MNFPDVVFRTLATPITFVLIAMGFHYFLRGHNAPGGGFIAGLIVAVAALLARMAQERRLLTLSPRTLVPVGLLIALVTGAVPMVWGKGFLTSSYGYVTWPFIGEFEWASAALFDLGVFFGRNRLNSNDYQSISRKPRRTYRRRITSRGGKLMELMLPFLAAILVAAGVFLVLSRALIRVILGLSLLAYGVNLAILLAGAGTEGGAPPLLNTPGPYVDPLPQALILTAIVIGFGTTALLLVLSMRAYQATGTDHVQDLVEQPDPPERAERAADSERPSVSPEVGPDNRGES